MSRQTRPGDAGQEVGEDQEGGLLGIVRAVRQRVGAKTAEDGGLDEPPTPGSPQIRIEAKLQTWAALASLILGLVIYHLLVSGTYAGVQGAYFRANPLASVLESSLGPRPVTVELESEGRPIRATQLLLSWGLILPDELNDEGVFEPQPEDPGYIVFDRLDSAAFDVAVTGADGEFLSWISSFPGTVGASNCTTCQDASGTAGDCLVLNETARARALSTALSRRPIDAERDSITDPADLFRRAVYSRACTDAFAEINAAAGKFFRDSLFEGSSFGVPERPASQWFVDAMFYMTQLDESAAGRREIEATYSQRQFLRAFMLAGFDALDAEPAVREARRRLALVVGYEQSLLVVLGLFALSLMALRLFATRSEYRQFERLCAFTRRSSEPSAGASEPGSENPSGGAAGTRISERIGPLQNYTENGAARDSCVYQAVSEAVLLAEREEEILKQAGEQALAAARVPLTQELRQSLESMKNATQSNRWLLIAIVMILPAIGFVGTVRGIMNALGDAQIIVAAQTMSEQIIAIGTLSGALALAFATTLYALVISITLTLVSRYELRQESEFFLELEAELLPVVISDVGSRSAVRSGSRKRRQKPTGSS